MTAQQSDPVALVSDGTAEQQLTAAGDCWTQTGLPCRLEPATHATSGLAQRYLLVRLSGVERLPNAG